MAQSPLPHVLSHWHHVLPGFSTSVQDFYARIDAAVARRKVPEASRSRIAYREAGVVSGLREYVRVSRKGLVFDICGAPFGTGFFLSWWLATPPPPFFVRVALLFVAMAAWVTATNILFAVIGLLMFLVGKMLPDSLGLQFLAMGLGSMVAVILGAASVLLGLQALVANGKMGEEVAFSIPLVGFAYERLVAPATYYRVDTALMFQDEVRSAFHEAVAEITDGKGLRALTEEEQKPILHRFGR